MLFDTNKEKGRAGLSMAIAYYGSNGYTVNLPINDTQWYDLVIEKDGVFQTVQCKATGSKDGAIDMRSTGGTDGGVYDHALNYPIDIIFCLNQNGTMYSIPVKDIRESKGKNRFTLRETQLSKLANEGILDTSKYIVKI